MTISLHARNIANELERAASGFVVDPVRDAMTTDQAMRHADTLRGAAALIRDLASNQLPDFDSIQPATPEPRAAEIVEAWSSQAATRLGASLSGAAARLSVAAAWIKARDEEIAQLRTALSRVQPPPEAFEPPAFEERPRVKLGPLRHVKLGEYLDARDLPEPGDSDPLQSQLAPLFALFRQQSQAQAEHWRALEFQTRRIANANALAALYACNSQRPYGIEAVRVLTARIEAEALK